MRHIFFFVVLCVGLFASTVFADDLLIFSADWCPSCVRLKQAIQANPSIVDGFTVSVIDFDAQRNLARKHGVKRIPTVVRVLSNGQTVKKVGFTTGADLKQWLQKHN